MEIFAIIALVIAGLVGFDVAALRRGADSRELGRDRGRGWSIR
jgi:hypothetical protein